MKMTAVQWQEKTFKKAQASVRKVVLLIHREVIKRTPVDTGWAKNHWRVGATVDHSPMLAPSGGGGAIPTFVIPAPEDVDAAVNKGGEIYIYNAVPYIVPLDRGHSKQAGKGFMVAGAVAAVRSYLGS